MTTPAAVLAKAIDGARLPNGSWAADAQAILAALPDSIRQNVEAALVGEDSKTAPVIDDYFPDASFDMRRGWEACVAAMLGVPVGEPKP